MIWLVIINYYFQSIIFVPLINFLILCLSWSRGWFSGITDYVLTALDPFPFFIVICMFHSLPPLPWIWIAIILYFNLVILPSRTCEIWVFLCWLCVWSFFLCWGSETLFEDLSREKCGPWCTSCIIVKIFRAMRIGNHNIVASKEPHFFQDKTSNKFRVLNIITIKHNSVFLILTGLWKTFPNM